MLYQERLTSNLQAMSSTHTTRGAFHRVGVDVLQLLLTTSGNKYVFVFMDYFTKWPKPIQLQIRIKKP